jgi:hypothetical protein
MARQEPKREIKVFCPTHGPVDASVPGAIACSGGGLHSLTKNFPPPFEELWEYCCACQFFWHSDITTTNKAKEQCVVCERLIVRRYLCNQCGVMSLQSDDFNAMQEFNITTEGSPIPKCPGCLSVLEAEPIKHQCKTLEVSFTTARSPCDFCRETIEKPDKPKVGARILSMIPALLVRGLPKKNVSEINQAGPDEKSAQGQTTSSEQQGSNSLSVNPPATNTNVLNSINVLATKFWAWLKKPIPLIIGCLSLLASSIAIAQFLPMYFNHKPVLKPIKAIPQEVEAGGIVRLVGSATDQDGDEPEYDWYCHSAKIVGKGPIVDLDMSGIDPPSASIPIEVTLVARDKYSQSNPEKITIVIKPLKRNTPPSLFVEVEGDKYDLQVGESVFLTANAKDPDNDSLSYDWQPSGFIEGRGARVRFITSGIKVLSGPIKKEVQVTVSDGHDGIVSSTIQIWIRPATRATKAARIILPKPRDLSNHSPHLIRFQPDRSAVQSGENVSLTVDAEDLDPTDKLTYQWEPRKNIAGDGNRVTLNTSGIPIQDIPISVTVTVTVLDGRGGTVSQTVQIVVSPTQGPKNSNQDLSRPPKLQTPDVKNAPTKNL